MTIPPLAPDNGWMGDPKRGASFGRPDRRFAAGAVQPPFYLYRLPLNIDGYDPGGVYWGRGKTPMWRAVSSDGAAEFFCRAPSRVKAWVQLCEWLPGAKLVSYRGIEA